MLTLEAIEELVRNHSTEEAVMSLVQRALENGGKDNVMVILLEIKQSKNKLLKIFNRQNGGRKI